MALSPQYSWPEPDNSSLVKNGAQDIRALGDAIDTSVWNIGFGQAGKNKIINGDMNIWQRGTSTSLTNNTTAFGPDRFIVYTSFSAGSSSFSRQSFTPGAAPVAGYESAFFARLTCGSTATYFEIDQNVEDVRTFAGNTVTLSFWAKASGTVVITPTLNQVFGSGGSSSVSTTGSNQTLTTSWARYSVTVNLPSISGKTIGTNSYVNVALVYASGTINSATIDVWGVQLEYGSKATPFETASGTLQGELALCQRYYWRQTAVNANERAGYGSFTGTTNFQSQFNFPVTMRAQTTAVEIVGVSINDTASVIAVTGGNVNVNSPFQGNLSLNVASGGTTFRYGAVTLNTAGSSYIGFSAEL